MRNARYTSSINAPKLRSWHGSLTAPQLLAGHNNLNQIIAPIITGDALIAAESRPSPQWAYCAQVLEQSAHALPQKPKAAELYVNMDAPFSAIVCGEQASHPLYMPPIALNGTFAQGSGNSYTAHTLLEGALRRSASSGLVYVFRIDDVLFSLTVSPDSTLMWLRVVAISLVKRLTLRLLMPRNARMLRLVRSQFWSCMSHRRLVSANDTKHTFAAGLKYTSRCVRSTLTSQMFASFRSTSQLRTSMRNDC